MLIQMRLRLSGGHFRMLNEKLYTCSGNEAFNLFKKEPELFNVYHTGYQEQMSKWPEQPVDIIINWLKNRNSSLVVADFGCGNASLARTVKNKVFSIDLVSTEPSVIACDMSKTPLESKSVDVAVFCLSLMGVNYPSYLKEANRVLKPCGWLLVAEVRSRFDSNNGGADPDIFSEAVNQLGFTLNFKELTNKMFVLFYFKKKDKCASSKIAIDWPELKPCLYKRR
ncbi:Ribosomal RNA-processing protein 8 [Platanthera zijinensis]|uniref:Ribosomal RNA-processing protein 8 n=1 Tax=Platanthera zijinensis TaxID=2320716 RepID=A0AAP0GBC5_9ASPA